MVPKMLLLQEHSFDQKFDKMNKALLLSCLKGLPVRVVRSHKERRSAYAPTQETPVSRTRRATGINAGTSGLVS